MFAPRFLMSVLLFGLGIACLVAGAGVSAQDKKKEKSPLEGKKGMVVGTLTEVGPKSNYIDVKADGEEKARRYVPHWVGGTPDKGGGPDKKMIKIISDLKVGSRLEVSWEYEERFRVVAVKLLAEPKKVDKK
jgi:hypothetical protein